jgi:hypothetical protein
VTEARKTLLVNWLERIAQPNPGQSIGVVAWGRRAVVTYGTAAVSRTEGRGCASPLLLDFATAGGYSAIGAR